MVNLPKKFLQAAIALIFAQIAAVVIAGLDNFSALGLIVAGFIDVVMIAIILAWLANEV